ncbi:MAG: YjjG family noncanonical pyrimidine nucleotidase [Muribaculaceae bacterium]|nr:YjjG family noncanonical pyrimidine nucleotidase [Muribaculaceae bacterium]
METRDVMLWFDLDDTVWDMSGNSVLCLRELYESQGLGRWFESHEQWDEIYHKINRELWEQYGRGDITRDYLRSERFARPLRIGGVPPADAEVMAVTFDKLYLDSLGQKTALVDGARELLDYLSERDYKMGIVSNGFREVQYNKLRSSGIDRYFDPVVLSDDAGINKPDRRFFDYAMERAGSRDKHNIIIGDNLTADIQGALDAGWEAIWFCRNKESSQSDGRESYETILSLTELKKHF